MFPTPLASVLSGASRAQLAYWRKHVEPFGALLVPEAGSRRRLLYSVADVVALRSIVYLREEKSLPKIRRAVAFLHAIERDDWTHLADYTLVRTPETIFLLREDNSIVDLQARPGQSRLALDDDEPDRRDVRMAVVLESFESARGREVPKFDEPRPGIRVDRDVLAGFPSIVGTRVPYDVIASLVADGVSFDVVQALYPAVPQHALAAAADFAELVAAA